MRRVYRIELDGSYHLRGCLRAPDQPAVEGRLTDISAAGAGLAFPHDRDPRLEVGDTVDLAFLAWKRASVSAPATVRTRLERVGFVRYGFAFTDPAGLDGRLPIVFRDVFNRRRAPRVRPDEPFAVRVVFAGGDVRGSLVDISTSGTAVEVPFVFLESFVPDAPVTLDLALPTGPGTFRVAGRVRGCRLTGPAAHVGVEFDRDHTQGFEAFESALLDFVAARELGAPSDAR